MKARRHRSPAAGAPDEVRPTAERRRHGKIERSTGAVLDVNEEPGRPFRALGTLDIMFRAGSITREMRRAGDRFHGEFVRAGLDPLAASDPTRLPVLVTGGAARRGGPAGGSEHARALVGRALAVLGGSDSTLGSCAYHVLGRELSLREWQIYRMPNRHQPVNFASGILVGALDLLRIHYDSGGRRRLS
jgi:hypothetical protein